MRQYIGAANVSLCIMECVCARGCARVCVRACVCNRECVGIVQVCRCAYVRHAMCACICASKTFLRHCAAHGQRRFVVRQRVMLLLQSNWVKTLPPPSFVPTLKFFSNDLTLQQNVACGAAAAAAAAAPSCLWSLSSLLET